MLFLNVHSIQHDVELFVYVELVHAFIAPGQDTPGQIDFAVSHRPLRGLWHKPIDDVADADHGELSENGCPPVQGSLIISDLEYNVGEQPSQAEPKRIGDNEESTHLHGRVLIDVLPHELLFMFSHITHHRQSSLDRADTHTADHFAQGPDTPDTHGRYRLDYDRLDRQCLSTHLAIVSTYNKQDGSNYEHGVSSTDRLGHVLSTKLAEYLTSTRPISLRNKVDLPEDTVENRHPGWIESPSPCLRVDVLTIRNVSDETLVG